ncbi:hypothetical protein JTE90_010126 [Oedothorax gibbosus]|uniref:Uncharacterized protein n=1 Tax=Oedothorax gibbosus TaxID=931172 RepID=A0AAV6UE68_9ARAC|nr:hypothetical protein JTE90_010126 [Oedothorax gibbosus]
MKTGNHSESYFKTGIFLFNAGSRNACHPRKPHGTPQDLNDNNAESEGLACESFRKLSERGLVVKGKCVR